MTIAPHGPYVVNGPGSLTILFARSRLDVTPGALTDVTADGASRLCRCGHSRRKPACDDACAAVGFTATPGGEQPPIVVEAGVPPRLAFIENGPMMVAGITIEHEDGAVTDLTGGELAMCRCGASRSKPWCDFSHLDIGFCTT